MAAKGIRWAMVGRRFRGANAHRGGTGWAPVRPLRTTPLAERRGPIHAPFWASRGIPGESGSGPTFRA